MFQINNKVFQSLIGVGKQCKRQSKKAANCFYQYTAKDISKLYLPLIEMLFSDITAIQHEGIQDMDGTNFPLCFPLGRKKRRIIKCDHIL